jgi:hypothetical protein
MLLGICAVVGMGILLVVGWPRRQSVPQKAVAQRRY